MKKLPKIAGILALVVIALLIGLVVLARFVITPELVKETVLPLAEDALQRKIEVGDISVSLFSGIELHDLKVYEADGREIFFGTDLARLEYQLLPLLALKVVVDEVTVVKPSIQVTRLANGRFSFADITKGRQEGRQESSQESSDGSPGSTPVSLLVSKVNISDGSLIFIDRQVSPEQPFRTEIADLQIAAKGITLAGKIPVSLSCKVNGGSLKADGQVSLAGPGVELDIKLDDADVTAYRPYFEDAVPGRLTGLKLAIDTRVTGGMDKVSATGVVTGEGLHLTLDAMPDAPLENARVVLDYDLDFDLKGGALDLRKARVDFNQLVAEMTGTVAKAYQTPQLSLQVSVPGLDLQQVTQALPAALVKNVKDAGLSGRVMATAQLSGNAGAEPVSLLKTASLTLDNVQAGAGGQRPALFGTLNLAGQKLVSEDLEMRMGGNRAHIDLNANNLFGKTVNVNADVAAEQFLLDPLLKTGGAAGAAADKGAPQGHGGASQGQGEEIGPFDIPVVARGTIKIGKTLYQGLAIDDFHATYQLRDNVLTISRMDGRIAGGSFANTARVDLGTKGLSYSASLGIKAVQADPLLTAFLPKAAGSLLGAMTLDLDVKGRGTRWQTLSRQLNGQGDILVADGRVVSPALVKGFVSFLQMSDTDEIRFKNFRGDVRIVDGKLNIDSSIFSDELKIFPKGSIGLDGIMNLSLDTRLSPALAARLDSRGKVTRYLTDSDGWSRVPLLVSGSYAAPVFGLDPKGLQQQATEALGKELGRQLDKLFGAEAPDGREQERAPADQGSEPAEDPTNKLLQDSLKRLFGN